METSDLENKARAKLAKKNLDMIVANNVKVAGAGFGTDTNVVTFITADSTEQLEIMSKERVAMKLLDRLIALWSLTVCPRRVHHLSHSQPDPH